MRDRRNVVRAFAEGEGGMTLVEVLAALFILTVAVLAMAAVASASLSQVRVSRDRDRATAAASSSTEAARNHGYLTLAIDDGQSAPVSNDPFVVKSNGDPCNGCAIPHFDHDGPGGEPPEPIVFGPDGPIDPYLCDETTACWGGSVEGKVVVRTFVTSYSGGGEPAVRVSSVASWTDQGTQREVRTSTVVANAGRGLPVPDFDIDGAEAVEVTDLVPPAYGDRLCYTHNFRNLGARDSYDFSVDDSAASLSSTPSSHLDPGQPAVHVARSGNDWYVQAWLGDGAPTDDTRMRNTSGDLRLDSAGPIENFQEVPLHVCFSTEDLDDDETVNETFTVEVRSAFAENDGQTGSVIRTVTYDLTVDDYTLDLSLHDTDPTTNHDRPSKDTRYVMNLSSPLYSGPLKNYDQDLDPEGYTGIFLSMTDAAYVGVWDHQFARRTILGGQATVVWKSGHNGSLRSGNTSGRPSKAPTYELVLKKVNTADGTAEDITATVRHGPEHRPESEPGFKQLSVTLDVLDEDPDLPGNAVTFQPNEFLVLELRCVAHETLDLQTNCHVMYDHTNHRSRLVVGSP